MQNQIQNSEISLSVKNTQDFVKSSEIKQSDVAIHTVEDYHKSRDKY